MPACTASWKEPTPGRCDRDASPGTGGSTRECVGHYQQRRRRKPYGPLRSATGELNAQVSFRLPDELKQAALADAEDQGIDEGEWWRRAGRSALKPGA